MSGYRFFLKKIISYALNIFLGIGTITNPALAEEWQWIRVSPDYTPNHTGWQILQGKTDVKIKDGRISAELKYDDEKFRYHFLIGGTISSDGEVSVTEIQENTDAGPRPFSGAVEIMTSPKADWEYDRILLKGGANFISLFRIVKK
jgi:hypothetical protein